MGGATLNPALVADWEGLRSNFTFDSYVNHDGAPQWAMSMGPCMNPQGQFQAYYVPECKLAYDFVQKWGTHVVTGLMTGSRALYWSSALSNSSYDEHDFRACDPQISHTLSIYTTDIYCVLIMQALYY